MPENEEVVRLEGYHGTCSSAAKNIHTEKGFRQGDGRIGTGAYFWKSSVFGLCLARCWYDERKLQKKYESEADPSFKALKAKFEVPIENYLDLEDAEAKSQVEAFLKQHPKAFEYSQVRAISGFYNEFIREIEKITQKAILVLEKAVTGPTICACYNKNVLGNPICFMVRDNRLLTGIEYIG